MAVGQALPDGWEACWTCSIAMQVSLTTIGELHAQGVLACMPQNCYKQCLAGSAYRWSRLLHLQEQREN